MKAFDTGEICCVCGKRIMQRDFTIVGNVTESAANLSQYSAYHNKCYVKIIKTNGGNVR